MTHVVFVEGSCGVAHTFVCSCVAPDVGHTRMNDVVTVSDSQQLAWLLAGYVARQTMCVWIMRFGCMS